VTISPTDSGSCVAADVIDCNFEPVFTTLRASKAKDRPSPTSLHELVRKETSMALSTDPAKIDRVASGAGFFAALDQSGGSTPSALRHYGIPDTAYHGDDEMFRLVQEMRERIVTSPAFDGSKVLAVILFAKTMDSVIQGLAAPDFLWRRGIVSFLKVDQGLEGEADGVRLMKPIPGLDALLADATRLGVIGTKMRSVINSHSKTGIAAIAAQQFEITTQIADHGLLPIIEPEISIDSPDEAGAEDVLLAELHKGLDALPTGRRVVLKLTIPTRPNVYASLVGHPRVVRVLALSGGYSRAEACRRLVATPGMIASFSRALLEDLRAGDSPEAFDAKLARSIGEIYSASVDKTG
jgi:fructose-bisphosphate aldolase, class I